MESWTVVVDLECVAEPVPEAELPLADEEDPPTIWNGLENCRVGSGSWPVESRIIWKP